MRKFTSFPRLLTVLAASFLSPCPARADDVPIEILTYWQFYNDTGWTYIRKGEYTKAEERFRMAIEEVRPFQKNEQRLLARSYADLARALYHQGKYTEAEPMAKWALSVRELYVKTNPDAVFQSLYTLAMIHSAQAHFDQAEVQLRRALELQEQ